MDKWKQDLIIESFGLDKSIVKFEESNNNLKGFAEELYNREENFNNCDISSCQNCFDYHEILKTLHNISRRS